ncbi:PTS glucitol/sorbitol transporter subunit IIA [Pectobacterium brasiliense]|uniref:PTS glucitol/sorbitol transporter subunit IIA n=1 Tax=Pectobacterium brasiliense TaxID=180957 RepID=UPI002A7F9C5D|nr:PTS glucitol/sorbitol transporter subunit IIA [Pectobacterium brasiliense]MDY4350189.1 PTS glucitol/sorbitol transporter subunit IIA [Pectobacterium brasiliense]
MRRIIWQAKISTVGDNAALFLAEKRLILFSEDAPKDIRDYCLTHHDGALTQPLSVQQKMELFGVTYAISAIGDVASQNLKELGHITLLFDGAEKAELPGTLHLIGPVPTALSAQGNITIFEEL